MEHAINATSERVARALTRHGAEMNEGHIEDTYACIDVRIVKLIHRPGQQPKNYTRRKFYLEVPADQADAVAEAVKAALTSKD